MEEKFFLPPRAQAIVRSSAASFENPSRFGGLSFTDPRLVRTPDYHTLDVPLAESPSLYGRAVASCGSAHTARSAETGLSQRPPNPFEFGSMALSETVEKSLNVLKPGPRAVQVCRLQIAGNGFSIHDSSRLPFTVAVNRGTVSVALRFPPRTTEDATLQMATKSSFSSPSVDIPAAHSDSTNQSGTSYACNVASVDFQENQGTPSSTYAESTP
jgi:hypothetical protein